MTLSIQFAKWKLFDARTIFWSKVQKDQILITLKQAIFNQFVSFRDFFVTFWSLFGRFSVAFDPFYVSGLVSISTNDRLEIMNLMTSLVFMSFYARLILTLSIDKSARVSNWYLWTKEGAARATKKYSLKMHRRPNYKRNFRSRIIDIAILNHYTI